MPGAVLRVSGSNVSLKRFLAGSKWQPTAVYWKGERRFKGSARVSEVNGFNLSVSDAPGSRLDQQVREVKRFLRREQSTLKMLRRLNLHSVIDFGVHAVGDSGVAFYRFDIGLLVALGKAGVEVVPTRRTSRTLVFRALTSCSHSHWATSSPVKSAIAVGCRSRGYSWQCRDVRLVC